jgi:hypothetical protein
MRWLTGATLQGAALPPDTARVTELIVFGPVILGGAAIAFFGRRLLAGAGLRRRAAVVTAVLAGVAAGATWLVFVVDAIFYAIGESGPEYYDFSTYQEYRDLTTDGLWFVPISLGYAALTTALALSAAVAWRRVHPFLGVALAAAACVAVVLPAEVPSRLSRVEYGKDAVLYAEPERAGRVEEVRGRPMTCIAYGVQGVYLPGADDPAPPEERLCIPVREDAILTNPSGRRHYERQTFHRVVEELNEAGVRPRELPPELDAEGLDFGDAVWIAV